MRRPRFIAAQARHAKGPLGRLIASIMARETWAENQRAIEALGINEGDRILDVGCGHGRSLAVLAARAPKGRVTGVDPSALMVDIAVRRNRDLVKARRVTVAMAEVDALPFPDSSIDKALCVHVLYFWDSLDAGLREIARVLKPGGRLALVFRSAADERAVAAFPKDIYRFPTETAVTSALEAAGFIIDRSESCDEPRPQGPALVTATRCG
ncbi:MAG: class I SAM-dependent methyltransferase [Hyphomonadaceae bacterium]|nr:class I SAM-dependent methyltransferase [Hyphomonadaceae bacterium]